MNNDTMTPYFKGRFLSDIIDSITGDVLMESEFLEEGTLLVHQVNSSRVYFQLASDMSFFEIREAEILPVLSGSAVGLTFSASSTQLYARVVHTRIPSNSEVSWYEKQNIV